VRGRGTIVDVIAGTAPFLICIFALTALITAFPQIVMWLPELQGQGR
jgi:TRAP-type C4-dicarboxylate transport system permease large subunit